MAFDFKDLAGKLTDKLGDDGFDIEELVEKAVGALKGDGNLLDNFKENPIKTIEKILNIDLPDEILEKIADAVKAKINLDDAKDLLGKVKGLFDKD